IAPGLDEAFPPLLSAAIMRHNLPEATTRFIGRSRELDGLARLLEEARIVTLTGPGGAGKTRLALELAATQVESHAHGVWMVELASCLANSEVPSAIATALRVREQPGVAPLATVTDALRSHDALVLLDNCEHVIDAASEAADALVRGCP